jgi:septal ring factor EnvC (AmiA/AmiB activator)
MDAINQTIESGSPKKILDRLDQLASKLDQLQSQINSNAKEKSFMENKISDAQNRIQKILNKLPQTADTRQLNLLDNSTSETSHE